MLNPTNSYNVDIAHSRSTEAAAACMFIKLELVHLPVRAGWSLIMSVATALIIPTIEHIGVAWTDIIADVLAVIGQG